MRIFIRADASKSIGTGHLMRCLSLCEELSRYSESIIFLFKELTEYLKESIMKKGFRLLQLVSTYPSGSEEDAEQTIAQLFDKFGSVENDWIIIDNYCIDHVWERKVKALFRKTIIIDDLANREHDCDVLIDTNLHEGNETKYDGLLQNDTLKLLGPKYALLRSEFKETIKNIDFFEYKSKVERIFVCFGGTDPTSETLKVVNVLSSLATRKNFIVNIVVGESNTDIKLIDKKCDEIEKFNLFVQPKSIAAIMGDSDIAICSGGSLTWERYCMGLPGLIVTVAENQVSIAKQCERIGIDNYLGKSSEITETSLLECIEGTLNEEFGIIERKNKARSIVDGLGVTRVANILFERDTK
ncbi:UDP-2,4-diacetamido-2,4,6-trideoxy-beta-L-altropyranose hydrolase [Paenibacillus sp. JJ-223]|uniref:UDP-2,4-diacetamido-2,4, 6-trideoxy-beta-L-altropyranose hydrolase n=1 Tax=Paenibacillus sp. JJ-223 TaxID=2905647 RepID=UPI001F3B1A10|nr:UDP-2,4-diacetamido-2,4,6-trideoxy-beta-L-altropyranose hydrolase [Paenibacillus sp. JJ-223]CAH1223793.1 UDP-2,4-diacetamido-2,4, 6-trideoxy-beta-L-altropyranose hydrolase [Paenibacillus sp. JJ-223]